MLNLIGGTQAIGNREALFHWRAALIVRREYSDRKSNILEIINTFDAVRFTPRWRQRWKQHPKKQHHYTH